MVGICHLIVPLPTSKGTLHEAKTHVESFLASLANFLCGCGQISEVNILTLGAKLVV